MHFFIAIKARAPTILVVPCESSHTSCRLMWELPYFWTSKGRSAAHFGYPAATRFKKIQKPLDEQNSYSRRILGMLKVPRYIPRCHATIQKSPRYNFGLPSGGAGTPKTVPRYNPNSPTLQFSAPRGHPKITKSNQSASPNHFFKTSENDWKKKKHHKFKDLPEPSERSWRLHKTSICTCRPCPKMASKWHPETSLFATFGIKHRWTCRKEMSQKNKHIKEHSQKS